MFTCCPNCETVFKVSAKHLQQAAGQVRCGQCEYSFNALSNIQESASEAAANLPAPADRGEDADAPLDDLTEAAVDDLDAAGSGQTATPDEVVLVEDAEAFEAAVLATIHATECLMKARTDLNPTSAFRTTSDGAPKYFRQK